MSKEKPIKEVRGLGANELAEREVKVREDLAKLQMQRHSRRLDKTSDLKLRKKDLARVLTVQSEQRRTKAPEARGK